MSVQLKKKIEETKNELKLLKKNFQKLNNEELEGK